MTDSGKARTPPSLSSEVFGAVLEAARAGAEWAWELLVAEIDPVLRGYLRRQGAADPDDLAGEIWLQVARSIGRFSGEYSGFRSWVFTIAHHRIIDERRRRGRRREDPTAIEFLDAADTPVESAESAAMETFDREEVDAILSTLSRDQREVMVLRVLGGFGITEIAAIMGKTPGAVQSLQHRAIRRLRKNLTKGVGISSSPSVTEVN
ncbi:MAG: RNA polymerase sigma factor [Acidimicrobiia bacterium]